MADATTRGGWVELVDKGWKSDGNVDIRATGAASFFLLSFFLSLRRLILARAHGREPWTSIFNYYLRTNGSNEEVEGGRRNEAEMNMKKHFIFLIGYARPQSGRVARDRPTDRTSN